MRQDRWSRKGRVTAPIVIEGEASVLARRPGPAASAPDARADAAAGPCEAPPRAFAREARPPRPAQRDLVFQGAAARPFGAQGSAAREGGLSVFARPDTARPTRRRLAGIAAALALLALPAGLLGAPLGDVVPARSALPRPALVIDGLVTSIRPRGPGAVLSVEGTIRNRSAGPAAVPPLRIALAETGGLVRTKALSTGAAPLGAGRSLRFHSTVAVAKETRGDIAVDFIAPPSGKTLLE